MGIKFLECLARIFHPPTNFVLNWQELGQFALSGTKASYVEGIFWISGTTSPYPIVYQRAGEALINYYPGAIRSATV